MVTVDAKEAEKGADKGEVVKGEGVGTDPPQTSSEPTTNDENINTINSESEDMDDEDENDPYTDVSSMSDDGVGGAAGSIANQFLRTDSGGTDSFVLRRDNSNEYSNEGMNSMQSPLDLNLGSSNEDEKDMKIPDGLLQLSRSHSSGSGKRSSGSGNGIGAGASDSNSAGLFQFSRSHSSGSMGQKGTSNTGNGGGGSGADTPVLECVTDPNAKAPSSPLGSVSVQSGLSPTAQQQRMAMPRFYDSEEEGAGSLVFVGGNDSASQASVPRGSSAALSPKMAPNNLFARSSNSSEDGGGSLVAARPRETPPRNVGPSTDANPQLLPYQHRKKLSQKDLQQPSIPGVPPPMPVNPPVAEGAAPTSSVDGSRRPPLGVSSKPSPPLVPTRGTGGGLFGAAATPDPPAALASKYKVAAIPPFRGGGGGGGQNHEQDLSEGDANHNNEEGRFKKMRKVKSATERPRKGKGGKGRSPTASPEKAPDKESKNRPPLYGRESSQQQEVIDPMAGSDYEYPNPPSSPRSGGYHIRVNSQGSISSLGSNAGADSDANAGAAPLHHVGMPQQPGPSHPNAGYYHYDQHYQQQQPQYQQQQQYHQQQHQQQYQRGAGPQQQRHGPPAVAVNYNDVLGPEIAHFIHGERRASGGQGMPYPPPPQGHYGHHPQHPPPHHPQQWNAPPHGGYGHPQSPYGYPPQYQGGGYPPEPQAPPLTQHPTMQWERPRERLHSVSEDEWQETLDEVNHSNRSGNGQPQQPYRGRGQREQPYPHGPPQRQYGQDPRGAPNPYNLPLAYPGPGGAPRHEARHSHARRSSDHRRRTSKGGGTMEDDAPNEKSSLLSPSGIRTYESRGDHDHRQYSAGRESSGGWGGGDGGREPSGRHYHQPSSGRDSRAKKSKRRRRKEKERSRHSMYASTTSSDEEETSRSTRQSRRRRHRKRRSRTALQDDSIDETYSESLMSTSLTDRSRTMEAKGNIFQRTLIWLKLLVCNLPLSFAAISFSIALLGIVWLKWAKEVLPSCKEVNFHSSQCTYPEFPGCYFCDEFNKWYIVATRFHLACSYIAGTSVMLFFAKAILCWRAFIDEMSSPTTASPGGLIFMTMALSFAGKGDVGEMLVFVASAFHLVLVVWFIYMSLAYQTMPDPSWFANTIGIGLCAVKIWFYYPLSGHFLIAITLMLTFLYYPISLIRVALNEKMSATICWMNMMGPAVPLYSLAIIMEPTFQQERPDISHFQTVQRSIYLPSMTCLFALCLVGMVSSVHGLVVRWKQIAREEFSPAHAAYGFPLLMHALAVQSYRSSLDFFAVADQVHPAVKTALHIYWVTLVVAGTITAVVCILMYLAFLPSWVDVDTRDEVEPPPPNETSICDSVTYGESLIQPYISPTILQANETGILIMAYDGHNGWCDLVRTRRIPAFGFEPMMGKRLLSRERKQLKLYMGGPEVIREGDEEEGSEICFEHELGDDAIVGAV